jgi:hypothetical protein
MTVKELKAKLNEFQDEMEVWISDQVIGELFSVTLEKIGTKYEDTKLYSNAQPRTAGRRYNAVMLAMGENYY